MLLVRRRNRRNPFVVGATANTDGLGMGLFTTWVQCGETGDLKYKVCISQTTGTTQEFSKHNNNLPLPAASVVDTIGSD